MMKRYEEYKPSAVRWLLEIPTHWEMSKAKYYFQYTTGFTPPTGVTEFYNGDITWVTIADMNQKVVFDSESKLSQVAIDRYNPDLTLKGSLLYSFKLSVGKVAYAGKDLYTNEAIISILPNEEYDVRYFYYTLPEQLLQNANENIYGAKMLNQELIRNASVCFPPKDEQTAIAAYLDEKTTQIDTLITNKQKLIELLQEERTAIINQAVTKGINPKAKLKHSGIEWLWEIPEHWKVRKLNQISKKLTNGYVGPTRDILTEEGVRYIQSLHIKGNSIVFDKPYYVSQEWSNSHSRSVLTEGDVLIVQTGDIGQVVCVPKEFKGCNCHALIIITTTEIVLGNYLSWLLNSNYGYHSLKSIQTGALHPHLNSGNVKYLEIPVPPIDEQTQIIQHIGTESQKIDATISKIEKEVELLQEYRTALVSEAVTGKIKVI